MLPPSSGSPSIAYHGRSVLSLATALQFDRNVAPWSSERAAVLYGEAKAETVAEVEPVGTVGGDLTVTARRAPAGGQPARSGRGGGYPFEGRAAVDRSPDLAVG